MAAAPMEAQTAQPPSDPSSATAPYPRWVMLDPKLEIHVEGSSCSSTSGDSKTLAAARASNGDLIQASLRLAEPPAVSCVCLQVPHNVYADRSARVVAAHRDSVLIEVPVVHGRTIVADIFVYSAGAATAAAADPPRPPSLTLIPLPSFFEKKWLPPLSSPDGQPTGLVRRGEDELVVAQLVPARPRLDTLKLTNVAELRLFRNGEWSIKRLEVEIRLRDSDDDDDDDDDSEVWVWEDPCRLWNTVIPVGDGLLCWVDLKCLSIMLCDVFEETPRLQFLPLPVENVCGEPISNRNVYATAGGDALKYVNVFPRCCCGGAGASSCVCSCGAYTIETWTMRIGGGDGDMVWVKDSIVDSSELWALDTYKGLRCLPLDHPVVSMDQPELICFWLHAEQENAHPGSYDGYDDHIYGDVDLLMVNTRSKTIHSVSRGEDRSFQMGHGLIPSSVSCFFNSYSNRGSSDAAVTGHRQVAHREAPQPAVIIMTKQLITEDDGGSNPAALASFPEPSVQEFFVAFQEIPSYGLGHDELKVYRILCRDNCRRFKSLLRLPKNLRKDWLLMEIKTSEDGSYDPTS